MFQRSILFLRLRKWAVIKRSPPATPELPVPDDPSQVHKALQPRDLKPQFVPHPFVKEKHLDMVQFIENRGMYREELCLERSRFPKVHKLFVVQTDGSIIEREVEYMVPPILLSFHDRVFEHRRSAALKSKYGNRISQNPTSSTSVEERDIPVDATCNAVAFPFCVPQALRLRQPLNVKKS